MKFKYKIILIMSADAKINAAITKALSQRRARQPKPIEVSDATRISYVEAKISQLLRTRHGPFIIILGSHPSMHDKFMGGFEGVTPIFVSLSGWKTETGHHSLNIISGWGGAAGDELREAQHPPRTSAELVPAEFLPLDWNSELGHLRPFVGKVLAIGTCTALTTKYIKPADPVRWMGHISSLLQPGGIFFLDDDGWSPFDPAEAGQILESLNKLGLSNLENPLSDFRCVDVNGSELVYRPCTHTAVGFCEVLSRGQFVPQKFAPRFNMILQAHPVQAAKVSRAQMVQTHLPGLRRHGSAKAVYSLAGVNQKQEETLKHLLGDSASAKWDGWGLSSQYGLTRTKTWIKLSNVERRPPCAKWYGGEGELDRHLARLFSVPGEAGLPAAGILTEGVNALKAIFPQLFTAAPPAAAGESGGGGEAAPAAAAADVGAQALAAPRTPGDTRGGRRRRRRRRKTNRSKKKRSRRRTRRRRRRSRRRHRTRRRR